MNNDKMKSVWSAINNIFGSKKGEHWLDEYSDKLDLSKIETQLDAEMQIHNLLKTYDV